MFKRTIAGVMILVATLCFTIKADAAETRHTKDDTWLVYMYICGTDLEENANASCDIIEMQQVDLPSNVRLLIYANGAINWKHQWIERKEPGIYLCDSRGLNKISSWRADMGKPDTLKKFLRFGEENFKTDHRIIVFWDHGGVNGICYDQTFNNTPSLKDFIT